MKKYIFHKIHLSLCKVRETREFVSGMRDRMRRNVSTSFKPFVDLHNFIVCLTKIDLQYIPMQSVEVFN